MLIPVILFAVGLLCLIKGGDWFVDGAAGIARRFRLPELLIGATIVSIGTTLPEVMVSATDAVTGMGQIAYGNALGSIICNTALIAAITIAVDNGGKTVNVKFDLILYRSLEWRISSFFRCIGQKKHGERLVMDWNAVIGSHGRAHLKPRTYVNRYGEEKTANDVDYFLDYEEKFFVNYHPTTTAQGNGWQEVSDDEELPFD